MRKRLYIFLMLMVACIGMTYAQDDSKLRTVYAQAESDYRIGRIEQARDALLQNLHDFHGNLRQNALRLIALSYLENFDIAQTEHYTTLLLQDNPYYTISAQDPSEFADIVNSLKSGMTVSVTTASNMSESLAEVPVPTTLITAEMIQNSGARNLQEVLAAYVPSMNIIDCNDDINIAMRGIYSNTQEKMLIMLNGHRLNSYFTNTAAPDFSISLEKVKQIEVLRGPASSIYGSVALTAVVNIITKQGADVDGILVKGSAGNHSQLRGDFVLGKRYYDLDILAWISGYYSNGERRSVPEEQMGKSSGGAPIDHIMIGHIRDNPSYDLGVQMRLKGWDLLYETRFSQVASPYTFSTLAQSYDIDKYRTYHSIGPSFANNSHHLNLSYSHLLGKLDLKYAAFYDKADATRYQVITEQSSPGMVLAWGMYSDNLKDIAHSDGLSRYINGQEESYGLQLKGGYNYQLSNDHKGTLVFGAEYSHLHLQDFVYQFNYDYGLTWIDKPELTNFGKGRENSADGFLQLKHQWHSLILNAGLRYDYKHRTDETKVNEWSPRVALIWLQPKWNVKLSYSKAFVDAPYLYRISNGLIKIINGSDPKYAKELSPERLYSWQLSFAGTNWVKGLNFEINGFYNRASDLIMTNIWSYENAAKNKTAGVELAIDYQLPRFTANLDLTWTHTFESNLMGNDFSLESATYDVDDNINTPAIVGNAVATWQATPCLKLHTHLLFESKQTAYYTDMQKVVYFCNLLVDYSENYIELKRLQDEGMFTHKDMPARAILDVGADYQIGILTLGLNIHNLFNTRYDRSGMNTPLIPQQGRWFLATVGVRF